MGKQERDTTEASEDLPSDVSSVLPDKPCCVAPIHGGDAVSENHVLCVLAQPVVLG
jgi:hypothetical protein